MKLSLGLSLGAQPAGAQSDPQGDLIASMNTAGGQSSFHDYSTATTGPWTSLDLTDNGNNHASTAGATKEPAIGAGGATFDSTDQTEQVISSGTFTVTLSFTAGTYTAAGTWLSDQGSAVNAIYSNGADRATALPFTTRVIDGETVTTVTTRGEAYDAIYANGNEKALEVEGVTMAGDTQLRIGRGSSSMVGTVRKVAVIDETAHAATLAADRLLARQAVVS